MEQEQLQVVWGCLIFSDLNGDQSQKWFAPEVVDSPYGEPLTTSGPEQPAVLHPAVLDKVPYKVQNSVIRYCNCGIDVQTGANNYRT